MGPQSILILTSFVMLLVSVTTYGQGTASLRYNIREQNPRVTDVGNIATDSRLYDNVTMEEFNRMRFQILTQGNEYGRLFQIDEFTSQLQTASVLDREVICPGEPNCVLDLNVGVYMRMVDSDLLDLYIIIPVQITLDDINDNAPTFTVPQVTIPITENSQVNSEYFTHGAIDLDTGFNNSVQNYFMEPADEMFGLRILRNDDGSTDLNIVVRYPLDRETKSFYQLTVFAVDGGEPVRTGTVRINITITDQNDNAPVFSEPKYNITVPENPPLNSTILTLTATDRDEGDNARVLYHFVRSTSSKISKFFSINESTGEIVVRNQLDYEKDKKFTFDIEAEDGGSPSQTTRVEVIINIQDVNDNAPQINVNRPPTTTISETAVIGSFVAHVAVFDEDNGTNGLVNCSIEGEEFKLEEFKIKDNYKIVLNKPLDHELQVSHDVVIECHDAGVPSNSNTTSFVVTVEDENDNVPIFSQLTYEVTIQEETFQTSIVQVKAVDADSGANGNVTYGILPNASAVFTIHPRTGLLTANSKFDREKTSIIRLPVLAWDGGEPSHTSTATVVLNISDINDNSPQFPSDPVDLYIKESQYSQTVQIPVFDPDSGINGQFVLTFPENDYLDKYFTFNYLTGEIATRVPIDREEIPFFKFRVSAVDRGIPQKSSSAEVIIHVEDENDNMPVITHPNNSFNTMYVPVSASVGHIITTVEAHDDDEGVNAQLFYFIDKGDPRNLFYMDISSGIVSVARTMEPNDADTYKLDIAVRDNGQTQRTSWAKLNIVVQSSNETVAAASTNEEEGQRNIMIVIIFVAVTALLSIGIVATIFVIRHIDRQNHSARAPKHEENKFYETAKVDESMSASSNISKDSDAELLKKRNKKEVSFSIDEESEPVNNSTLTNVTSFSTVKDRPSYLSMDYKPEESQTSSWMYTNTSSDLSKTDLYSERSDRDLSALSHSQLQQALHQIQAHTGSRWPPAVRDEQSKNLIAMLKKAEDANSEASAETSTSDSGRGGSEEDIHSNRGHTLSDTDEAKQYHQRRQPQNLNNKIPTKKHHRPPPPVPVESYPRNISFSDDSVTANTTVASYKHSEPNSSGLVTPVQNLPRRGVFTISGVNSSDTFLNSQMTTPGFVYSLADIDDVSEMANTRDDASTTTSGSYTINPDELCNEIDELFFKDVIV